MPNHDLHDSTLPPPLMTSEPGSFARQTIVERKPQIISQVIQDNDYTAGIVKRLESFKQEIASQPVHPLSEDAPGVASWNQALAAYEGRTWLDLPWYLAETYFYRRLLEEVGYFQPGPYQGHDPFGLQKRAQIEYAVARLAQDWDALASAGPDLAFEALLHSSLWGNRADLSNYTVSLGVSGGLAARDERHNILIDHTEEVHRIVTGGIPRVDFINDNVGLDLLFDLALIDLMLRQGWVERVVCHLKDHPFFVSDAMPVDLQATVSRLSASPAVTVQALGERLRRHLATGDLALEADPFWTSHLMFRDFPPGLRDTLARSDLVVLKGDVNYRRLLDDRHWLHTTPLERIAAYFPAPLLVLRTLKGEIQVGLAPGQAEALAAEDPGWLINGRRGLVQYCNPRIGHPAPAAAQSRQERTLRS
jgi:uncharacterized protein with ATP-grasp and redox domains